MTTDVDETQLTVRPLAEGNLWRIAEVTCRARPCDPRFEEVHDWTAIGVVLEGVFTYRSVQGRSLMMPGAWLLGDAGTCFECGHDHGAGDRCVAFHFAPELLEDARGALCRAPSRRFRAASLPPAHARLSLLAQIRRLAASPDPLRAETLLLDVALAAAAGDADAGRAAPSPRDERKAAEAIQLIETRLTEPFCIAHLARTVGLGTQRFAIAFRRAVGVAPYNYIISRRLDLAAQRLSSERPAPVLQIALDVGFGDLSEFTRRFKDRFGRPPAAYRHAVQGDRAS